MKSCPTCNKTFTDPNLSFCIDDGTPLVTLADIVVSPSSSEVASTPPSTEAYKPRDWQAPDYQPPGFQPSTAAPPPKKTWPWVVGVLVVLGIGIIGIGVAGAIIIPNMMRKSSNRDNANPRVERSNDSNSNLNSNAPNSNSNNQNGVTPLAEDDDTTPPPTDKDEVLAVLRALEQEWTVANINADKEKLGRILADDYSGKSIDGKVQGKAQYLREITPDTAIQKWDFEELQVTLMGDRAILQGVIRLQLADREAAYQFTDKFVWRDGRWQAVGSEVSRIK